MTAVRILGVDPGSRYTGYGLIDSFNGRNVLVAAGRLNVSKGSTAERLLGVLEGLGEVIAEHNLTHPRKPNYIAPNINWKISSK